MVAPILVLVFRIRWIALPVFFSWEGRQASKRP